MDRREMCSRNSDVHTHQLNPMQAASQGHQSYDRQAMSSAHI